MPWRGPELPGEFPTLGWLVGDWIETYCVIPDGAHAGQPYRLTDEMWRFLAWHYRLKPNAKAQPAKPSAPFVHRRSQLVRPQKWGKGPFSGAIVCAEADGPVLFDGWDANGEPVGRPWDTPWIQITAVSESQTDNVWRALQPMIELGPLADRIPDTGETRINLPGGGRIEPVTASARSRLGQRITLAVQDETHSWLEANGGIRLADNQKRNLGGMGGRSIETTNAWDPNERSVAQLTHESAATDIYRDFPRPPTFSADNKRERRKAMKLVYGDSWWVDLERIDADFAELAERDVVQALRFFCNVVVITASAWMDPDLWACRTQPRQVAAGSAIALGFDGSQYDDVTVLRAETPDGYQFTPTFADGKPTIWDPAEHGGEVPRTEVDAAVHELFARFNVTRMYCDPPYWQSEIDGWAAEFGDARVVRWETKRDVQMSAALERFHTDVTRGQLTHDDCPVTADHMRNARKVRRRGGICVQKDRPGSPRKIDAVPASTLAHEAACDAGAPPKKTYVYTA